jgi:hypothetical protein
MMMMLLLHLHYFVMQTVCELSIRRTAGSPEIVKFEVIIWPVLL